jgi:putative endonuclease
MSWYVYMVRCKDDTLYTGITTDVARRVAEHNGEVGRGKGAKYTAARRPVVLVYEEPHPDKAAASRAEYALRTLSRAAKFARITGGQT